MLKEIRKSLERLTIVLEPEEVLISKEELEIEKLLKEEFKRDAIKKKKPKVSKAGSTKIGNVPNISFNPALLDSFGKIGRKG